MWEWVFRGGGLAIFLGAWIDAQMIWLERWEVQCGLRLLLEVVGYWSGVGCELWYRVAM